MKNWMDCVWITLGKESATNKEIAKGLNKVLILAILEVFRRRGLVYLDKKSKFDKTKLGKEVAKYLENLK